MNRREFLKRVVAAPIVVPATPTAPVPQATPEDGAITINEWRRLQGLPPILDYASGAASGVWPGCVVECAK